MRRNDDFDNDRIPAVPYVPFRCPNCQKMNPRTYGTRGRMRYHKCQSCGVKYRSFEVSRDQVKDWESETGE